MATIQEKISTLIPQATFSEAQVLQISVPDEEWHKLAKALYEDANSPFDYLTTIVGMDWGETVGCLYYLESTKTGDRLCVRVETNNKENPMLHSVSDLWESANFYEREVYDFFGIIFINHPDMRRLFLRRDWVGHPLRKDYDASPEVNPVRLHHEEAYDTTISYVEQADGSIKKTEPVIFAPDDYVINIGPQHPSTHGVLRLRCSLDGEFIKKVDPYCGYIHRGIEKMCESLMYPQTLHFTDRLDYLSAMQNRHALCMCIEDALQVEIPERAQYIRTINDELMRISSHLLFWGTFCNDLGSTTALIYGFREREMVLDILEETTGARMSFHYNKIGGVMKDIHHDYQRKIKEFCKIMPERLKEYHRFFTGNVIA